MDDFNEPKRDQSLVQPMKPILIGLIDYFREPIPAPPVTDGKKIDASYSYWRSRMLLGSLISYALFYLTRKNLAVAMPLLSADLHYSNSDLGILGSMLYISYGISKGLFGFIADRADPRKLMTFGLLFSAIMNVFFSFSSSLIAFGIFWMFNGVFLATGAPACAKICTRWFSISERGTKWSIWNISQQVGAGLVFILSGMVGTWLNWRGIFLWPGLICILGAGFIWLRLGDRPESKGLPPVDIYRNDPETATTNESVHGETSSFFHLVVHRVLMNRNLLIIALASMFVYIVRVGTLDWMTKYLVEEKEQNLILGSGLTSMIEFFGIPSCLLVGWISDRFFRARRAPICVIFLLALTFAIGFVYFVPPGHPYLDGLSLALVGFFIYGPQMMLAGVASADTGGSQVAAAAVGVTGVFSYLGATISSIGTGVILDVSGWGGGFVFWTCCSLVACILLIPLWNVRGRQKQASR